MDFTTLKRLPLAIDHEGEAFQVLDLASDKSFTATKDQLAGLMATHLVLLKDGKDFLEKTGLRPTPMMRILCLKTIDQILHNEAHLTDASSWLKKIHAILGPIKERGISELISLECQLLPAVVAMQHRGIPFIKHQWQLALSGFQQNAADYKTKLDSLLVKKDGFLLFGQQSVDLHNTQDVKSAFKDLTGHNLLNTAQSSLKDIPHEAAQLLVSFRACERMLNTYGDSFLGKVENDRLRGKFVPLGSSSGRFSCHEPNLLALPNHPSFQACIKAPSPYKIMHFDYSAFELRILAALSQDKAMIDIFTRGLDIHSMVAEAVFGQEVSKSKNPHLRDQAKLLNFGLIYGMKENSLSRQLKISVYQAKTLLQNYFKKFSRVGEFLRALEETAKNDGFTQTALGRRALLVKGSDDPQQARVARNLPIQGTGADIIKLAVCRTFKQLIQNNLDAHLINVIHDELVIEYSGNEDEVKAIVKKEMEQSFCSILPNVIADISC